MVNRRSKQSYAFNPNVAILDVLVPEFDGISGSSEPA
jgi:hypothetical protein